MIIDTIKSKYNLKNGSFRQIALMPEGIITAYRNEISGQFLIIKLRSNIEIKISENELSECTKTYYFKQNSSSPDLLKNIKDFLNQEFIVNGNKQIKELLNPFSFLKWIKYSTKDVF